MSERADFAVELPVFTGPFRALAELILDHKVDVCDVSVATVTERFLAQAKEAKGWNLEEATWFLAICAVLLELKVGRLMPKPEELRDEDLLGGSPGAIGLADDKGLLPGAVVVEPDGAAAARRGARDRVQRGEPDRVEGRGAGDLLGGAPGAVGLTDDKHLDMAGAVRVQPAGAAVARRRARY